MMKEISIKRFFFALAGGLLCNTLVFAQSPTLHGKATQEMLYDDLVAAAPSTYPLDSKARVTNNSTGKEIEVTIIFHIAPSANRIIDLSLEAWEALGMDSDATITVAPISAPSLSRPTGGVSLLAGPPPAAPEPEPEPEAEEDPEAGEESTKILKATLNPKYPWEEDPGDKPIHQEPVVEEEPFDWDGGEEVAYEPEDESPLEADYPEDEFAYEEDEYEPDVPQITQNQPALHPAPHQPPPQPAPYQFPQSGFAAPLYHLLVLDRAHSHANADIGEAGDTKMLYKFKHGEKGYLVALFTSEGTAFPSIPEKSRIIVKVSSARKATIQEYVNSSEFKRFVANPVILSQLRNALEDARAASVGKTARIQVGAFAEARYAADVVRRLQAAGFRTAEEPYNGLTRVLAVDIPEADVQSAVRRLEAAGFKDVWVRK